MSDQKSGHRYQKIFSRIWEDEKFINLSTAAQLVYLYLQSNRSQGFIGFYILTFPANRMVCGFKDWEEFKKGLSEVIEADMIKFDEEKSLILINNFLKYNPILSPTQLAGARRVLLDLPKSKLFYDFLEVLQDPKIAEIGKNAELIPIVQEILETVVVQEPEISPSSTAAPVQNDAIDWVVRAWDDICGKLFPKISKVTEQRKAVVKARLEEYGAEKIKEVFCAVTMSPFLRGENDRGWKADFDFVMSKSKFTKILEGSYQGTIGSKKDPSTVRMERSLEAIARASEGEELLPHNQLGEEDIEAF
jgi:hypothetical protein